MRLLHEPNILIILVLLIYGFVYSQDVEYNNALLSHKTIINDYYKRRQNWTTSNLGSILFKNIGREVFRHVNRENRTFLVYYWNARHHVQYPLDWKKQMKACSVNNCKLTSNQRALKNADVVLIHMQRGIVPNFRHNHPSQKWIFLSYESPKNTFSRLRKLQKLDHFDKIFNWTMNFRSDADIPVPYGRTIPLPEPATNITDIRGLARLVPNWQTKKHDVLVTIFISDCRPHHWLIYLKELKLYIPVQVIGNCSAESNLNCNGTFGVFGNDCNVLSEYLFYLAFENSMCRQYFTEKTFHNAYSKGAIPVIMGPPIKDCRSLLPPNSYLHVNNYRRPEDLAKHIKRISIREETLLSYHSWRNHFKVTNEHGFFGRTSLQYCRLCEALNYNDGGVTIYDADKLRLYFDPHLLCTVR